jgi:hypothetical protein
MSDPRLNIIGNKKADGLTWGNQAWWYMLIIQAVGRLRQQDIQFEAS